MQTTQNPPIPFQVRDIWLAAFALERGLTLQGVYRDERTDYLFWDFDAVAMIQVMREWGSGQATVNVRTFHTHFFYLKGTLSNRSKEVNG